MTPDPLPPDLLALERALTVRPRPEPPAELRARVLDAVSRERPTPRPEPVRAGFARFAAATAAAALLAINLSASLANGTDWRPRSANGTDFTAVAARLRAVDPDMPDREARRQVLVLRAAAGLAAVPAPAPTADRILHTKDPDRWDTH